MRTRMLLAAMLVMTVAAWAADISGTWKGTAETANGTVERTFVFKVDGSTLTGETSSNMFGKSKIEDGKIDGNNISFSITVNFDGNEGKVLYKGTVDGDQIKMKADVPAVNQTVEYTVKRVS